MNQASTFLLALAFALAPSFPTQKADASHTKQPQQMVHFSVINMSGAAREAHLRGSEVKLPVARAITLQAPAGTTLGITSGTSTKVETAITVTAADEGRLFPIA